ncbi:13564_t:CDS:2, partial [Gigaspora margarita]
TCLNSLIQNQLALQLTITKLAYDSYTTIPEAINDIIKCENFWENIKSLLTILDKLVTGISTNSKFIQQYYPDEANIIWQQLLQYKTKTGIFDFNLAWNAIDELDPAAVRFNSRSSESHKFKLLDPNNGNKSSEDELAESSKGELAENDKEDKDKLSESEIELLMESDIDSEDK